MNVLFYSSVPTVRYGGVVGLVRRTVTTLRDMGHRVHVLTWGRTPPDAELWGEDVHFLPLNQRFANLAVMGFWYRLLMAAQAGRRLIREHDIQVLHTVSVYETWSAALARGSAPTAIVLSIHGDFVTEQDEWWKSRWRRRLYLPLERSAFRNCQAVTTSSAWLQRRLAAPLAHTRAVVIPNGIDLPPDGAPAPDRRALGLPEDRPVILTLNSLYAPYRRQALQLLLAAAPAILEKVPDALFVVVGGVNDAERDRELLAWARGQATGLPFLFTGFRQRSPEDFMAAADLYVHPSYLDNTPTAVMEAMALGKAIVATRVGGIPDLVEHERTGLLVPPGDEGALVEALERLLLRPEEREAMGAAAREVAQRRFDVKDAALALDAFYRRLLAQG